MTQKYSKILPLWILATWIFGYTPTPERGEWVHTSGIVVSHRRQLYTEPILNLSEDLWHWCEAPLYHFVWRMSVDVSFTGQLDCILWLFDSVLPLIACTLDRISRAEMPGTLSTGRMRFGQGTPGHGYIIWNECQVFRDVSGRRSV